MSDISDKVKTPWNIKTNTNGKTKWDHLIVNPRPKLTKADLQEVRDEMDEMFPKKNYHYRDLIYYPRRLPGYNK